MDRLEELKTKATWHDEKVQWYMDIDLPYSEGAAQYHQEQSKKYWNQYGRLVAETQTKSQWKENKVYLAGKVIL